MHAETALWSLGYREALSEHLKLRSGPNPDSARELGRRAVALGLETLDVARIHQQTMMIPESRKGASGKSRGKIDRAKSFFGEVIVPIESTHRAARRAAARARRLTRTLLRRTREASAAVRELKRGTVRRRDAETALQESGKRRARMRRELLRRQNRLRRQLRAILAAQEAERRKTSRRLQDGIAQVLLAIDVGLLTLQGRAKASLGTLEEEVAGTQRLVGKSVRIIHRLAHEIGIRDET